jgi:hypothetical protein
VSLPKLLADADGIYRPTVAYMLLVLLHEARLGLRRRSITETNKLKDARERWLEICEKKPHLREPIPPEVVRFIERFKRPRGRMTDRQAEATRWSRDPNRVAAYLAAKHVKKLRRLSPGKSKREGPHKIMMPDGSKRSIHDVAVEWAIADVNWAIEAYPGFHQEVGRRRPQVKAVKELLRQGRTGRGV